jgi:methyl-accepting chemotaxis protein WspA
MGNWSIRSWIIAAFSIAMLILGVLTLMTFRKLQSIGKQATDITGDSLPGLLYMSEIDARARTNYGLAIRGMAASMPTESKRFSGQIQANNDRIEELLKAYEPTVSDPEDRGLLDALKHQVPLFVAAERAASVSDARAAADTDAVRRELDSAQEGLTAAIDAEMEYNKRSAQKDAREVIDEVQSSERLLLVALVLGIVFAMIATYVLLRAIMRLVGDIRSTGIAVNTSATEIAATAREHQATANEIAATTSEIGATSREISATSRELSRTMTEVTSVAERTAVLASSGQSALVRMEETIQQITEAAGSISAKLTVLNDRAANIGSVVTTINKVADQTNLLSLNAAIEAEKAGEYGRGFAVVATEIRRLADQTAVSTHDIEQMVKQMQSAVSAGVMGMEKFAAEVQRAVVVVGQVSDELSQIIDQVQTLTPSFENVNDGMQAQAVAAQQISDALGQLSEAAQQTVDSLRQSNVAIEQLNLVTRNLQTGVSRFAGVAA